MCGLTGDVVKVGRIDAWITPARNTALDPKKIVTHATMTMTGNMSNSAVADSSSIQS